MTTPAGWYPEPDGQQQRYWDGERWTEHVAPLATPADVTQATDDGTAGSDAATSSGGRGKVVGGIAAAALVVAGGLFAWTQLSSAEGGAGSPEDAVVGLLDAVSDEDLVGVAETVLPGERRTYVDPALEGLGHLQRWGVLSDDFDTSDVAGIDLEISDVTTRAEAVADDVVNVYVSGTIGGTFDAGDLPLGDLITDRIGADDLGAEAQDAGTEPFDDLMITAVRQDGRWYVSGLFTAAEHARAALGVAIPSSGIAPIGADGPEAAVQGFVDAAASFDLEGVIARLNPDEAQVLQRYAPLFLADAQAEVDAAIADAGVSLEVDLETEVDERDGIAVVAVTSFSVDGEAEGEAFSATYADGCAVVSFGGETEEVCADDVEQQQGAGSLDLTDTPAGDLTAIFDDMEPVGLVVAEHDGQWFVSPIRTYSEGILSVMRAIDRDEVDRVVAAFEDGSMVEWLEDQLVGSFATDFEGMLDDEAFADDLFDDDQLDGADLPSRPEAYGDDPDLDALWDGCETGDMAACDDLYWSTGVGTEYEAFGETCGNRVTEPVYGACVVAIGPTAA